MAFRWKDRKDLFKGEGVYFLTFNVVGRARMLGEIMPLDEVKRSGGHIARVHPSSLGMEVYQEFDALQGRHPGLQVLAKQVMPDHFHAVVWCREGFEGSIKMVARGFSQACSRLARQHAARAVDERENARSDRADKNGKQSNTNTTNNATGHTHAAHDIVTHDGHDSTHAAHDIVTHDGHDSAHATHTITTHDGHDSTHATHGIATHDGHDSTLAIVTHDGHDSTHATHAIATHDGHDSTHATHDTAMHDGHDSTHAAHDIATHDGHDSTHATHAIATHDGHESTHAIVTHDGHDSTHAAHDIAMHDGHDSTHATHAIVTHDGHDMSGDVVAQVGVRLPSLPARSDRACQSSSSQQPSYDCGNGANTLFETPFIRTLTHAGQLRHIIDYTHNNPDNAWLRKTHPDLYVIRRGIRLAGLHFDAMGKTRLLDYPDRQVIALSRSLTPEQINDEVTRALHRAEHGAVTYTAAISAGEKQVARAIREAGYPMVVMMLEGFPAEGTEAARYFHPSGVYHTACGAGLLLLLAPHPENYADPEVIRLTEAELQRKAAARGLRYEPIPHSTKRWQMVAGNVMMQKVIQCIIQNA